MGGYTSLEVDVAGGVHVSYLNAGSYELHYAYRALGGGWTTEAVDSVGDVGRYTSELFK